MRRKTKILIALGVIAATSLYAIYADVFHIYTLRDDNGGQILWDGNEAYLFMSVVRRGYRLSWSRYAGAALLELFNAPPFPTDQRTFLTVIRITPTSVERYPIKLADNDIAGIPHFFTPVGHTIYAFSEGTLYKWVGDRFEAATQEEQQGMGGMHNLYSPDIDGRINGWTIRGVGTAAGDFEFSVNIGPQLRIKVKQGNVYESLTDSAIVSLERSGQPPQELWHVNGAPRIVSKREYERAFSEPHYQE